VKVVRVSGTDSKVKRGFAAVLIGKTLLAMLISFGFQFKLLTTSSSGLPEL